MYWRFTYRWWYSVTKQTMFVKADTEEKAIKIFESNFGYEDVDILDCTETTEQDILKETVKGYEN